MRRQVPVASPLSPGRLGLAAVDALRPGAPPRERLRTYLAERFGAEEVLLTASGTQALQLALTANDASGADPSPVALPAYSCYDLVSAAVGARAPIAFYDIDPLSLTPERESLKRALEAGARTVVAANLHGFPLDWAELRRACAPAGALVVEDAAQGLGSGLSGQASGSFGDLTVLSFGRGKGWTGGSGGGLLVRRMPEGSGPAGAAWRAGLAPAARAAGMKALVTSYAQWALGRPWLYRLPGSVPGLALGETHYHEPTRPARISGFAAAAALRHAEPALEAARGRRLVAEAWDRLRNAAGLLPGGVTPCRPIADGEAGWLRYPVLAPDGPTAQRLARDGVAFGVARGYPLALPDLPAARPLLHGPARDFPAARLLADTLLTLPTHAFVGRTDLWCIRELLAEVGGRSAAGEEVRP